MLIVRHNNELISRKGNMFVHSICNDLLTYAKHKQILIFYTQALLVLSIMMLQT